MRAPTSTSRALTTPPTLLALRLAPEPLSPLPLLLPLESLEEVPVSLAAFDPDDAVEVVAVPVPSVKTLTEATSKYAWS